MLVTATIGNIKKTRSSINILIIFRSSSKKIQGKMEKDSFDMKGFSQLTFTQNNVYYTMGATAGGSVLLLLIPTMT